MSVDMSPEAILARLDRITELADLRPEHRLLYKIDYSPRAIGARLRTVAELSRVCLALGRRRGSDIKEP